MPLIKLVYSPKNMNKNDTDKFLTMKVDFENSNFKNYKHLALYVNSQNTVKSLKHIHIIDKIKLILYPQVRNSITKLIIMQSQKNTYFSLKVGLGLSCVWAGKNRTHFKQTKCFKNWSYQQWLKYPVRSGDLLIMTKGEVTRGIIAQRVKPSLSFTRLYCTALYILVRLTLSIAQDIFIF